MSGAPQADFSKAMSTLLAAKGTPEEAAAIEAFTAAIEAYAAARARVASSNGTHNPQAPPVALYKQPSPLAQLDTKSRAMIEAASANLLRELVAVEAIRRVQLEQQLQHAAAAAQQGQQSIAMLSGIMGNLLAHYTRAGALAKDGKYASLEAQLPMDARQEALPAQFQINWQLVSDPADPRRKVLIVRLVRPDLAPQGAPAPGLVGADGKPVAS